MVNSALPFLLLAASRHCCQYVALCHCLRSARLSLGVDASEEANVDNKLDVFYPSVPIRTLSNVSHDVLHCRINNSGTIPYCGPGQPAESQQGTVPELALNLETANKAKK